jgi:glycerol-3-phosphate dehydrogenase (NAD(P)+)
MSAIAILGAGSWGTALAVLLERHAPMLWDHDAARAARIAASRRNPAYLPNVELPAAIRVSADLGACVASADTLVVAIPSHSVREVARRVAAVPPRRHVLVVNAAKGLEERSGARMSQVLASELPDLPVVSLVGPSHAEEVATRMPTSVVVAGSDEAALQRVQDMFTTEWFRVYTNTDLVGVELAVSVKNVIAIAAGICDGLGFGDNSKGALLTRGLAEMARLGVRLGARAETFAGLAGLGDLVTTAISRHSRNRALGERIGRGMSLQAALAEMTQVVEGVRTTRAVVELAHKHNVEVPISAQVHAILFAGKEPRAAIRDLMLRAPKPETWTTSKGAS